MPLHHFVPQFYLKNFSIREKPNFVWVYRRDNQDPQARNVIRVSAIRDYYRITLKDTGEKSEQFEKMFSQIEGDTKPLIDRCLNEQASFSLSNEEYGLLALYMALQYMRGPTFRMRMHNSEIEFLAERLKGIARDNEAFKAETVKMGLTYDDEADFERTREIFTTDVRNHFNFKRERGEEGLLISLMIDWAEELAQLIFYKKWFLFESKGNGAFVTSDNPVTVMQYLQLPHKFVSWFETGIVALPISPSRSFLLEPGRIRRQVELVEATRNQVHQINRSTMGNAHREIYSNVNSKPIKRAFIKTKDGASESVLSEQEIEEMEKERIRLIEARR